MGNLPYVDKKDNTINPGRTINIQGTKDLITATALKLGCIVTESDLDDITEERWNKLYQNALEGCAETAKHNAENERNNPENYDE